MAEPSGANPRRVFVPDGRGIDQFLRVTWHPDGRQFVVSVWQSEVCVAATRIDVDEAASLIALLASGIAEDNARWRPGVVDRPA